MTFKYKRDARERKMPRERGQTALLLHLQSYGLIMGMFVPPLFRGNLVITPPPAGFGLAVFRPIGTKSASERGSGKQLKSAKIHLIHAPLNTKRDESLVFPDRL